MANLPEIPEIIDRLRPPDKMLTPPIISKRLFEAFGGYNEHHLPSEQVSFLLRHYLIYGTHDGDPVYAISSPELNAPVLPWKEVPIAKQWVYPAETTNLYSAFSPEIIPASLHNAPDVITVTDTHHRFIYQQEEHDILITRNGPELTPYWYIKGVHPVESHPMIDLENIKSSPLWNHPDDLLGTFIQLWKFLPAKGEEGSIGADTYQLQAALKLCRISLKNFLHVLGARPYELRSIEASAQKYH